MKMMKVIKEQIASKCECYNPETKSCSETLSGSCCGEMCQTFNLIKQLCIKTQEYRNLSNLLHDTDIYSMVCMSCRDEILTYPSINDKTSYTDNEVDTITLKRIIDALKNKEQECEKLEKRLSNCIDCRASNMLPPDCDELRAINDRYYNALEEIENNINKYFEEAFYKNCRYAKGCTNACGLVTNSVLNKNLDIIKKAKGGK